MSLLDDFTFTGKWWVPEDSKCVSGTLIFKSGGLSLESYTDDIKYFQENIEQKKIETMFGVGSFAGEVVEKKITLFNLLGGLRSGGGSDISRYKYTVLQCLVGVHVPFVDVKVNSVNLYLTNLTNWINAKPYSLVKYPENNNGVYELAYDRKENSDVDLSIPISSDDLKVEVRTDRLFAPDYSESNNIESQKSMIKSTSYFKLEYNPFASMKTVQNHVRMFNDWYSLVEGHQQVPLRISLKFTSGERADLCLSTLGAKKDKGFDSLAVLMRSNDDLKTIYAVSLSEWVKGYKFYAPILSLLNRASLIGDLELNLECCCRALQVVFDTFYKEQYKNEKFKEMNNSDEWLTEIQKMVEYSHKRYGPEFTAFLKKRLKTRKKRTTYREKVDYILHDLDTSFLTLALGVNEEKLDSKIEEVTQQILNIRNVLSHSSPLLEKTPGLETTTKQTIFANRLKNIILFWLLRNVKIPVMQTLDVMKRKGTFDISIASNDDL